MKNPKIQELAEALMDRGYSFTYYYDAKSCKDCLSVEVVSLDVLITLGIKLDIPQVTLSLVSDSILLLQDQ